MEPDLILIYGKNSRKWAEMMATSLHIEAACAVPHTAYRALSDGINVVVSGLMRSDIEPYLRVQHIFGMEPFVMVAE